MRMTIQELDLIQKAKIVAAQLPPNGRGTGFAKNLLADIIFQSEPCKKKNRPWSTIRRYIDK